MEEIFYTKEKGCGHCHGEVLPLFKTFGSDMVCVKCGAIFTNYDNLESESKPGEFTGRYDMDVVPKQSYYMKGR